MQWKCYWSNPGRDWYGIITPCYLERDFFFFNQHYKVNRWSKKRRTRSIKRGAEPVCCIVFACSIWRAESAEQMRKRSLGTIGLLIRSHILTSAWHGVPRGCVTALDRGAFHNPMENQNGLGAVGLKVHSQPCHGLGLA